MKKNLLTLCLSLLILVSEAHSQDIRLCAYNAAFNGLACGIGAGLHHKPFLTAFAAGLAAGSLNYYAKNIVPRSPWLAKGIDALSTNMVANVSAGRGFHLDKWRYQLPVGPCEVTYDSIPHIYVRAFNTGGAAWLLVQGYRFDWSSSLSMAGVGFYKNAGRSYNLLGNTAINKSWCIAHPAREHHLLVHETVHAMQHYELSCMVAFQPLLQYHVWCDWPVSDALYSLQGYHHNVFEQESYWIGEGVRY
jgi:hypothetical protein